MPNPNSELLLMKKDVSRNLRERKEFLSIIYKDYLMTRGKEVKE